MTTFEWVMLGLILASLAMLMSLVAGSSAAIVALTLVTLAVIPHRLTPTGVDHVGITTATPSLMTFTIPIVLGQLVYAVARRTSPIPRSFLPLSLFLLVGLVFFWPSQTALAGTLHILTGVMAWGLGYNIAVSVGGSGRLERLLGLAILGVLGLQLSVGILQDLGFAIFQPDARTAELTAGRVNGTLNHPTTLGKMVILLILISLPLTLDSRRRTRLAAIATLPVGFAAVLLTESRANIVSLIAIITFWAILMPGRGRVGIRTFTLTAGAAFALFAAPTLIERFNADPHGGERARLMADALRGIPNHLFMGVGPNSYVEQFGYLDPLVAAGWPVHNAFLLAVAELGLAGAALLFAPFALAIARSTRSLGGSAPNLGYARVLLVSVPGLYLVTMTGWGILQGSTLPLLFFTFGYCSTRAVTRNQSSETVSTDLEVVARV